VPASCCSDPFPRGAEQQNTGAPLPTEHLQYWVSENVTCVKANSIHDLEAEVVAAMRHLTESEAGVVLLSEAVCHHHRRRGSAAGTVALN